MAEIRSCHTCVYGYVDRHAWPGMQGFPWPSRPVCANHPDSMGQMRPTPFDRVCVNYRLRPATPEGEVRQIALGHGAYVYVDAADYEWLSRWTWYLGCGYAYRLEKNKMIYMHRQIMQPPKGMLVHHKNRNKLDNTRPNLHNCTPAENARHRAKKRNASSRFWGVSYTRSRGKYQVSVHYEGEVVPCGWFTDEIEAARAHDYKAVALKGESARLNFPEEWPTERRAEVHAQRNAGEKAGKKVRTDRAGTGRRPRPRGTGRKRRATAAQMAPASPRALPVAHPASTAIHSRRARGR